jgi:hypothetical protein
LKDEHEIGKILGMIQRMFIKRAFAATVAVACGFCVFTGCGRQEPPKSSPHSYMKDQTFVDTLKEQKRIQGELVAAHNKLASRMAELIEAKKKELKTEDLEKVRLALEQSEEWKSLHKRCLDAATAIKENRKKTEDIVRKRISK